MLFKWKYFFGKVSWNLTVFQNFQCSDWLIQWSHDLKWDFERFQAYLKLLEVMHPYRTLKVSNVWNFFWFLIWNFSYLSLLLIWFWIWKVSSFKRFQKVSKGPKVSNSTSHFKSHLKVSNNQKWNFETWCAISALHKANWLPCLTFTHNLWIQRSTNPTLLTLVWIERIECPNWLVIDTTLFINYPHTPHMWPRDTTFMTFGPFPDNYTHKIQRDPLGCGWNLKVGPLPTLPKGRLTWWPKTISPFFSKFVQLSELLGNG